MSILHQVAYWSRYLMGILANGSSIATQNNRTLEKRFQKFKQYIRLKRLTQACFKSLIDPTKEVMSNT
jgi:hypothetical protein